MTLSPEKIPNLRQDLVQWLKGLKATTFADICWAFIEAAYNGLLKTDRQKEIAKNCLNLYKSFAKAGIESVIDEVTGKVISEWE